MAADTQDNRGMSTAGRAVQISVGGLLVLAGAMLAVSIGGEQEGETRYETIHLADERFEVELAVTDRQRNRGMAGREEVAPDEGMLFVFERPRVLKFWMKGCLIPLDILFVDASGRIVRTHTMPPPDPDTPDSQLKRYSSYYPAQFAIEVKAGTIERLGLEEGESVDIPLERLKRIAAGVDEDEEDGREERKSTAAGASQSNASTTADQP